MLSTNVSVLGNSNGMRDFFENFFTKTIHFDCLDGNLSSRVRNAVRSYGNYLKTPCDIRFGLHGGRPPEKRDSGFHDDTCSRKRTFDGSRRYFNDVAG